MQSCKGIRSPFRLEVLFEPQETGGFVSARSGGAKAQVGVVTGIASDWPDQLTLAYDKEIHDQVSPGLTS